MKLLVPLVLVGSCWRESPTIAPPSRPATFACGNGWCKRDSQYCERGGTDVTSEPDRYECLPLPSCTIKSCLCLSDSVQCFTECSGDAKTGMTVFCIGG